MALGCQNGSNNSTLTRDKAAGILEDYFNLQPRNQEDGLCMLRVGSLDFDEREWKFLAAYFDSATPGEIASVMDQLAAEGLLSYDSVDTSDSFAGDTDVIVEVQLTDKGREIFHDDATGTLFDACSAPEFGQVTGIIVSPGEAVARVDYTWQPGPARPEFDILEPLLDREEVERYRRKVEGLRCEDWAPFALYDDGWRLVEEDFVVECHEPESSALPASEETHAMPQIRTDGHR